MKYIYSKTILICAVLVCFLFSGCRYASDNLFYKGNSVDQRENSITELKNTGVETISGEFSYAVITDVHLGNGVADLPQTEFFRWLDSKKGKEDFPKFVLCLGDVADHGYVEEMQEYKAFTDKIEAYGIKVFNTVGNHDLYNSGWQNWQAYAYPNTSFYKFETADYSFYSLDSGSGGLGKNQLKALEDSMKRDPKPKIVFTHYPVYTQTFLFCMEDSTERNKLIAMFAENNVKLFYAGHIHKFEHNDFGSYDCETLPSMMYNREWAFVTMHDGTGRFTYNLVNNN